MSYKEGATRGMYRPLGDGDVDVGRVIDLHERAGYRGWYMLEQDTVVETDFPQGEGPISDVRKNLDFVKGRLAGARAGERGADG